MNFGKSLSRCYYPFVCLVILHCFFKNILSRKLLAKLELEDLDLILRERRLCWFGHVERSSGAVRTAHNIQIDGRWRQGGPS